MTATFAETGMPVNQSGTSGGDSGQRQVFVNESHHHRSFAHG